MFNSNLSLNVPPLLGIDGGVCTTPRTPEILNSLMAMTNPLEYSYQAAAQANINNNNSSSSGGVASTNNNSVSQNSHDSHSNSSDSPLDSPAGHHGKTPSVQQTRSQLIKAGVKLLIQNKRKHSGCDSSDGNESSSGGGGAGGPGAAGIGYSAGPRSSRLAGGPQQKMRRDTDQQTSEDDIENQLNATSGCSSTGGVGGSPRSMLTPEDEDRRRRRRERNKIAATKCRMKKRERTVNLVNESETLDAQNKELKSQVSKLENERRKLIEVLQAHSSTCVHQKGYQPLPSLSTITNNNCKYLNDLNFLDSPNEIKYSECLKTTANELDAAVLPPGYCKLSPTEVTFGTPGDVMDVNSFTSQTLKTEYIPSNHDQQQHQQQPVVAPGRAKPGPKPRQRAAAASMKRTVTVTSTTATVPDTPVLPTVPVTLPSADFILKNELIDTSSPYTTVQSADRFLFENTLDLYNNNNNDSSTLDGHHTSDSDKLVASLAVKDNASNALLELNASFDSSIFKSTDYTLLATHHTQLPPHQQQQQSQQQQSSQQHQCHLQQSLDLLTLQQQQQQPLPSHHQMLSSGQQQSLGGSIVTNEYLILPEHDGSEFTDLDSGITSYTINGSCLA